MSSGKKKEDISRLIYPGPLLTAAHSQCLWVWPEPLVTLDKCSYLFLCLMKKLNWILTFNTLRIMEPFLQTKIMQKVRTRKNPKAAVIIEVWQMALRGIPSGAALNYQLTPPLSVLPALVFSELSKGEQTHLSTAHAFLSALCCYHTLATRPPSWQTIMAFPSRVESRCWCARPSATVAEQPEVSIHSGQLWVDLKYHSEEAHFHSKKSLPDSLWTENIFTFR